jgi:pimeloyl-ACP methyl ester carboxylesterase
MQVIVDALLTHYEQSGTGRTVILLHGWGDNGEGLYDLRTQLAKSYHVIALDLPGFGGSQAPSQAWGLSEYGQFVQAFLGKIGVERIWAVIGHSNGGAIAIRAVAHDWLKPERVVLLAAAGIRGVYKGRNRAYRFVAKTGKAAAKPLPKSLQNRLRKKLYATIGSDMLVAEHLQETFKRIVSDDVREDAQKVLVPTLLIYGESDTQTPIVYGEQYHQLIPDSTLEVLPSVGHFVHLERPEVVVKAITGFLA